MMVSISFIIPANNASSTLVKCVESILLSTEKVSVEVLIIENGSTDGTLPMARELASKYSNVKVFKSDKGVSCARNCGINLASGEWLFFVDADDYLQPFSLSELKWELNDSYDVIFFPYIKNHKKVSNEFVFKCEEYNDVRKRLIQDPTRNLTVWSKAFRTKFIKNNKLYFDEMLSFAEDSDFLIRVLSITAKIGAGKTLFYNYQITVGSSVRKVEESKINEYHLSLCKTKGFLQKNCKEISGALPYYILMNLNVILVNQVFSRRNKLSFHRKYALMKKVCDKEVFLWALRQIQGEVSFSPKRIPLLFLANNCYFGAALIYVLRAYLKQ